MGFPEPAVAPSSHSLSTRPLGPKGFDPSIKSYSSGDFTLNRYLTMLLYKLHLIAPAEATRRSLSGRQLAGARPDALLNRTLQRPLETPAPRIRKPH